MTLVAPAKGILVSEIHFLDVFVAGSSGLSGELNRDYKTKPTTKRYPLSRSLSGFLPERIGPGMGMCEE